MKNEFFKEEKLLKTVSDNANQFCSDLWLNLEKNYPCKIRYTLPYNPMSDPVERMT